MTITAHHTSQRLFSDRHGAVRRDREPRNPVDGQFTDQRIYVDNAPVDSLLE